MIFLCVRRRTIAPGSLSILACVRALKQFKEIHAGETYNDFAAHAVFMEKKMKSIALLLATASIILSGTAHASADLAKTKNCMACHAIDKKVLGPGFKEVAAKYKGDKGADARLAAAIAKGSSGKWGAMAMPPNAVSEAEALQLAKWVMAQ
jgi:cytochrome c